MWPRHPGKPTRTITHEPSFEPCRLRIVSHQSAILIDVAHDVLGKDPKQHNGCLVVLIAAKLDEGLIGSIRIDTVIRDATAQQVSEPLDPAILSVDFGTENKGITVGGHAGAAGLWKLGIIFGTACVIRRSRPCRWQWPADLLVRFPAGGDPIHSRLVGSGNPDQLARTRPENEPTNCCRAAFRHDCDKQKKNKPESGLAARGRGLSAQTRRSEQQSG